MILSQSLMALRFIGTRRFLSFGLNSGLYFGKFSLIALLLMLGFSQSARAQWFIPGDPEDWKTKLGMGAALRPDFPGAANHVITPVPFIDLTYKKRFFLNSGRGLGLFLYGNKNGRLKYMLGASVGPSLDNRSANDIEGLPKVGLTAEGRVFGEVFFDHWSVELTIAKDLLGEGHEGLKGDLGLNYTQRLQDKKGLFRIGPQIRFGSGDYMDNFFSVTAAQSIASGLRPFDADAGLQSIGGRAFLSYPLFGNWNAVGAISYFRLLSDSADSPVSLDNDQIGLFAAIAYRF